MAHYQQSLPENGFYPSSSQFQYLQGSMNFENNNFHGMGSIQPRENLTNETLPHGLFNAFSTKGYSFEPPLMEELGINFQHIVTKTKFVLKPMNSNQLPADIINDRDLSGPLLFCLFFGTMLLTVGKVHFGYIYGVASFGSLSLYHLLKLMSNDKVNKNNSNNDSDNANVNNNCDLTFLKTTSILGYCFLPLCFLSLIGIFINLDNSLGYFIGLLFVIWCTWSSSGFFTLVLELNNVRMLIAYPLMIFYSVFTLMAIFV